ncbi:ECF subfamily RNA polymerase sigma-24 factor [Bacillus coahuilensis m2-6]|uniref:sigma-70 family RNA polymerase sigma factor n=1 Tax=Bacillus coahuilensis TaxID=408580 RepID=UPI00075058FE|nr:sigma-70 family RNA polymerase sigma factor [Bacillus coahuilensis]KUP06694.1 ECF subfamily RNA polymerase sigma-24 factor [Bacillus coahuilensis m2-6]
MSIERLVKKAKKGDKHALLELISNEQDSYYRLSYSYLGNESDAMDALEDMIVILYEKIDSLKKEESFYSWSKTILVNRCKAKLRSQKKVIPIDDMEKRVENGSTSFHQFLRVESLIDLNDALSQISEEQKEAILLKYIHDFDTHTIARMTNVPEGTVKSRVHTGLGKMRNYLERREWNE